MSYHQGTAAYPQAGSPPRGHGGEVTGVRRPSGSTAAASPSPRPLARARTRAASSPRTTAAQSTRGADTTGAGAGSTAAAGAPAPPRCRTRRACHDPAGPSPLRQQQHPDQPGRREQQRLQAPGRRAGRARPRRHGPRRPGRSTCRLRAAGDAGAGPQLAVAPVRAQPFGAGRGEQRQQPVRRCRPGLPRGRPRPDAGAGPVPSGGPGPDRARRSQGSAQPPGTPRARWVLAEHWRSSAAPSSATRGRTEGSGSAARTSSSARSDPMLPAARPARATRPGPRRRRPGRRDPGGSAPGTPGRSRPASSTVPPAETRTRSAVTAPWVSPAPCSAPSAWHSARPSAAVSAVVGGRRAARSAQAHAPSGTTYVSWNPLGAR